MNVCVLERLRGDAREAAAPVLYVHRDDMGRVGVPGNRRGREVWRRILRLHLHGEVGAHFQQPLLSLPVGVIRGSPDREPCGTLISIDGQEDGVLRLILKPARVADLVGVIQCWRADANVHIRLASVRSLGSDGDAVCRNQTQPPHIVGGHIQPVRGVGSLGELGTDSVNFLAEHLNPSGVLRRSGATQGEEQEGNPSQ